MKKEGLKIISAEVKNFQSLEEKIVNFDGKSIVIIGKNQGSKSSLIRAIQSPLSYKSIPSEPIQKGKD